MGLSRFRSLAIAEGANADRGGSRHCPAYLGWSEKIGGPKAEDNLFLLGWCPFLGNSGRHPFRAFTEGTLGLADGDLSRS